MNYDQMSKSDLLAALKCLESRSASQQKDTESRYQAVVEDQTDLICRFRPDCTLIFVNGAYAKSWGLT